jgi:hypothetical protein
MRFEYEITSHSSDVLHNQQYFCSPDGECFKEKKPEAEQCAFQGILNERGLQGWEFIQLIIADKTVNAFWKRQVA